MSEITTSSQKRTRLWPMAMLIFAIIFGPALLACAINAITH